MPLQRFRHMPGESLKGERVTLLTTIFTYRQRCRRVDAHRPHRTPGGHSERSTTVAHDDKIDT
jgi:hypothetical protein